MCVQYCSKTFDDVIQVDTISPALHVLILLPSIKLPT